MLIYTNLHFPDSFKSFKLRLLETDLNVYRIIPTFKMNCCSVSLNIFDEMENLINFTKVTINSVRMLFVNILLRSLKNFMLRF
jgi:hypothetical protein